MFILSKYISIVINTVLHFIWSLNVTKLFMIAGSFSFILEHIHWLLFFVQLPNDRDMPPDPPAVLDTKTQWQTGPQDRSRLKCLTDHFEMDNFEWEHPKYPIIIPIIIDQFIIIIIVVVIAVFVAVCYCYD